MGPFDDDGSETAVNALTVFNVASDATMLAVVSVTKMAPIWGSAFSAVALAATLTAESLT